MLVIKSVSAPVLAAGVMPAMTFGQFEKVSQVLVSFDGPQIADWVFEAVRTLATNVVTVTFRKQQTSAGGPTWGNAGNNDITGRVTVLANGY